MGTGGKVISDNENMLTSKQKVILFLISCDPGIKSIHNLVKFFDRYDFPSEMSNNLKPLLNNNFIFISKDLYNGAQREYQITQKGKNILINYYRDIIDYTNSMKPSILVEIIKKYLEKGGKLNL